MNKTSKRQYVPYWNSNSENLNKSIWNPSNFECSENKNLYWSELKQEEISKHIISDVPLPKSTSEKIISCKIKFLPNKEQKIYLQRLLSAGRYFYNRAVEEINKRYNKRKAYFEKKITCVYEKSGFSCQNEKVPGSFLCDKHKEIPWNLKISRESLRDVVIKKKKDLNKNGEQWQKLVPYDTRDLSVNEAVIAYSTCVSNKMKGNIQNFQLKFRNKRHPKQSCWIDNRTFNLEEDGLHVFRGSLKKDSLFKIQNRYMKKLKQLGPNFNSSDVRLVCNRGAYYFIFCIPDTTQPINCNQHSIALDPGIRTFQTGYSPNGQIYKIGEEQKTLMIKLHERIDKLKSVRESKKGRTRQNLRKKINKLELKIQNVIHNLHNQVGSVLAKNYRYILLPTFGTSVMQKDKKMVSVNKRRLNGWSHFRFQQKLIHLCEKYGSKLILVDESFTTKTCGNCGTVKDDVKGQTFYSCSSCGYGLDRDIHGARNIWIKYFSQN